MAKSNLLGFSPDTTDEPSADANPGNESSDHPGAAGQPEDRAARQVFTERECLEALTQLSGLLAMRLITPAYANSMRAVVTEILRHHQRAAHAGHGESQPGLADDIVLEIFDRSPAVLDLLSPLMTAAQVELIMRRATTGE